MTLNIFKPLLSALLISETLISPSLAKDPVCIIGSGISGLSAAHRLKDKGYSVKLFEKEAISGGKVHVYRKDGIVWNMGPVIFTDYYNRTMNVINKYKIKYTTFHPENNAAFQLDTGIVLPLPHIKNGLLAKEAWSRYQKIRKSYTIESGLIDANPELFVSTSEWLKKNKLQTLLPFALIFLTAEGYGNIDDTPAIYFTHILDLVQDNALDFHFIPDGMDQIPFALAKDLDITYNAQVSNIVRYKNSVKISYSTKSGIQIQKCSSAILAFTPLLNQLKNMISDLSEEEKDVLGQVKVHKYATIANYAPTMKYFVYAPLLPPPFPPNMDNGIPALIVNQTRGAAVSYHSNRGSFDAGPTDEELAHYKSQNHKFFPKLFNSKDTKTNIYIKGYEYFPHVTTESLQDGFYDKFNSIQGKNNIYYATPLLSFEVIEHSIRTAEYIVESFF